VNEYSYNLIVFKENTFEQACLLGTKNKSKVSAVLRGNFGS